MNSLLRQRAPGRGDAGFTLMELIVVSVIVGTVVLIMGQFFLNYISSFKETQARLRLQRDMRSLSYWIRKDLSAMAQRAGNFDLKSTGSDFAFVAADDPGDTQDWSSNSADNQLDHFTYTFAGNRATRTWDRLGTMSAIENDIVLEAIEPDNGDTYEVRITLYDTDDSPVARTAFDATLGNFELATTFRRVEMQIIFSKRPTGLLASRRSSIIERAEIKSVALYRRN